MILLCSQKIQIRKAFTSSHEFIHFPKVFELQTVKVVQKSNSQFKQSIFNLGISLGKFFGPNRRKYLVLPQYF